MTNWCHGRDTRRMTDGCPAGDLPCGSYADKALALEGLTVLRRADENHALFSMVRELRAPV